MGLKRWIGKGAWTISDQVVFGAANFLLNLYAADKLGADVYGAFAIAFAVHVLLLGLYNAVIIEPLLVYGPSDYRSRFREYMGVLLNGHVVVGAAAGLVFFVMFTVTFFTDSALLANTFLGAAITTPFTLGIFLTRRASYVPDKPHHAVEGGVIYLLVMLGTVWWLNSIGMLSPFTMFCAMGGAALLGSLLILIRLNVRWLKPTGTGGFVRELVKKHWHYGKWAAPTRLPQRIPASAFLIMLGAWGGLAATGVLQALLNLIQPATQFFGALGILIIASLAKIRGTRQFFTTSNYLVLAMGAMAVGYALVLGFFGEELLNLAYPSADYSEFAPLLWLLGLVPIGASMAGVFSAALRAAEQPDWNFWAYVITCSIALPASVALIYLLGLQGAIWSYAVAACTPTVITGIFFYRLRRKSKSTSTAIASA